MKLYLSVYQFIASHARKIASLFLGGTTIFFVSAFYTHNSDDYTWLWQGDAQKIVTNYAGTIGAYIACTFFYLFGAASFFFILFLGGITLLVYSGASYRDEWERLLACLGLMVMGATLCTLLDVDFFLSPYPGGVVGYLLATPLKNYFGISIATNIVSLVIVALFILVLRFSFLPAQRALICGVRWVVRHHYYVNVLFRWGKVWSWWIVRPIFALYRIGYDIIASHPEELVVFLDATEYEIDTSIYHDPVWKQWADMRYQRQVSLSEVPRHTLNIDQKKEEFDEVTVKTVQKDNNIQSSTAHKKNARFSLASSSLLPYRLPPPLIFSQTEQNENDPCLEKELQERAAILEKKLRRFGVTGAVVSIKSGPVVTLFEYKPEIDSKISKIVSLEDDLALALQALSIRIIAPIPGRSVVGFEVSNRKRNDVFFSSIVHSQVYAEKSGDLLLVLGKNTVGDDVIIDLVKSPHLLIAGSTGSGKSVALNTMLVSLLCKLSPEKLRLILIDPKRLEFSFYSDIAHLLFPIVTDAAYVAPTLRWVVQEMERRYQKMAVRGARNVSDYNSGLQLNEQMARIVVVIDELADLMITTGRDVENLIMRIAQMARAAGIHMIVATQRPSVDVITGIIKVNFPSRISFRVSSKIDSRTILDCVGAEKLLGRGDMLYLDAHDSTLKRVHGAYVSDDEILNVVGHIKQEREAHYLDVSQLLLQDTNAEEAKDEFYDEVLQFLEDIDEVSISLLQRKFRIGYNRSARIIDMLESQGLIMPGGSGKTRKVIHYSEENKT